MTAPRSQTRGACAADPLETRRLSSRPPRPSGRRPRRGHRLLRGVAPVLDRRRLRILETSATAAGSGERWLLYRTDFLAPPAATPSPFAVHAVGGPWGCGALEEGTQGRHYFLSKGMIRTEGGAAPQPPAHVRDGVERSESRPLRGSSWRNPWLTDPPRRHPRLEHETMKPSDG